jgi:flotillin
MYSPVILGQSFPGGWLGYVLIGLVFIVAFLFSMLLLLAKQYKRCPSNRVLVIWGRGQRAGQPTKTIHAGAQFVIPLLEDYAYLSLEPIQIEIPLAWRAVIREHSRERAERVHGGDRHRAGVMQQAAIRLLGLSVGEIRKQAEEMIFGQLRQVIASMGIEEINRDRDKFLEHIQQSLEPELAKIGLQLINVNITDITDESGYIDAIGQKAASEAIQKARGDVAENERMGETRVAGAERDKTVQVAEANKDQAIGVRMAERDKAIQIANLEKEQAVGERAADFTREAQVKAAEKDMRVQRRRSGRVGHRRRKPRPGDRRRLPGRTGRQTGRRLQAGGEPQTRSGSGRAGDPEPSHGQGGPGRSGTGRSRKAGPTGGARQGRKSTHHRGRGSRGRTQADRRHGQADAIFAKLDAEARGQYEILAKKGQGLKEIIKPAAVPRRRSRS